MRGFCRAFSCCAIFNLFIIEYNVITVIIKNFTNKRVEVMEYNLIMLGSVTFAMKSRNILMKNNISSKIVRTPMHLTNKSCGYSLYLNNHFDRALEILRSNGISILGTAAVDRL